MDPCLTLIIFSCTIVLKTETLHSFYTSSRISLIFFAISFNCSSTEELNVVYDIQERLLYSIYNWVINHITGVKCALINFSCINIFNLANNLNRSVLSWLGCFNIKDSPWAVLHDDERTGLSIFDWIFSHIDGPVSAF